MKHTCAKKLDLLADMLEDYKPKKGSLMINGEYLKFLPLVEANGKCSITVRGYVTNIIYLHICGENLTDAFMKLENKYNWMKSKLEEGKVHSFEIKLAS